MDEPQLNSPEENATKETSVEDTPGKSTFNIETFEATRSIATRQIQRLQELKKELKLLAEQLNSLLENDPELVESEQNAKELNQKTKTHKAEIMETNEAKNLKLKIVDIKEERDDVESSLSGHLMDLYQTTGVTEFEDTQGHIWEYNIKAKVKAIKS